MNKEKSSTLSLLEEARGEPRQSAEKTEADSEDKDPSFEAEGTAIQAEASKEVEKDLDAQALKQELESMKERFKKTQSWATKAAQEKTEMVKKLSKLVDEGHLDEEELKQYTQTLSNEEANDFWPTVESQVKTYAKTFGDSSLETHLQSFKDYANSLFASDQKAFEALEQEISQTPKEEWVKFTIDKGKEYYDNFSKHLNGKPIHEAFLDLLKTSEKLKQKLQKQESVSPGGRPLLNGGASGQSPTDDSDDSHVSPLSLLEHGRRAHLQSHG